MDQPWAFGWNHVLTLTGFAVTSLIAWKGFRSFDRWREEKLEEKRIDIAFEALALAYETRLIFEFIRNGTTRDIEFEKMPFKKGESPDARRARGAYFAVLARLGHHSAFFDKAVVILPKCMALFGVETERVFLHLFEARNLVHEAASELTWNLPMPPPVRSEEDLAYRLLLRGDIWGTQDADRVQIQLDRFREGLEKLCRPVVDRNFKK